MNTQTEARKVKTKDMIYIAIFAAIIAVMAQISIPMPSGVPMTLQTLAVPLAGLVLGAKRGTIATVVYVLLGAIGVPVFAGFTGGLGSVLGVTGGFIVSFPVMAWLAGMAMRIQADRGRKIVYIVAALILGAVINYLFGMIWFSIATGNTLSQAFMLCVLPFIPTTIIKIAIAAWIGPVINRSLERAGIL